MKGLAYLHQANGLPWSAGLAHDEVKYLSSLTAFVYPHVVVKPDDPRCTPPVCFHTEGPRPFTDIKNRLSTHWDRIKSCVYSLRIAAGLFEPGDDDAFTYVAETARRRQMLFLDLTRSKR